MVVDLLDPVSKLVAVDSTFVSFGPTPTVVDQIDAGWILGVSGLHRVLMNLLTSGPC